MDVLLCNSTICRLCAEENSNGILIFDDKNNSGEDISALINKYLPLKISNDGKFPCSICPGCNIQLEATMQFFELMIAGQAKLRELYKQQQEDIKRLQKQAENGDTLIVNGDQALLQKLILSQNNETEEIFVQFVMDGNIFAADHEQCLKAEGLDKPRRKRGRPPKKLQPQSEPPAESVPQTPKCDDDEVETGRRRRKIPARFQEAVQGKELERIFREEGVIDENDSDDETRLEKDKKNRQTTESTVASTVIGHEENVDGVPFGELISVNHTYKKRRNRVKIRRRRFKYPCDICGKIFHRIGRYHLHKKIHEAIKKNDAVDEKDVSEVGDTSLKMECEVCQKTFVSKQSLEVHLKGVHEKQRPFTCNICAKTFAYVSSLKSHLLSHEMKANKGYPCDICGKVLNHPSSIIYHKQSEHSNGRRFVCNKCNKSFKIKQLLQRHQLVHSTQRPYQCKICNAQFKAKSNLMNHQFTHTGVKKYACEQCGQQFAHKTSLNLHYRWHNGYKPFSCVFCDKKFSQNGNLQEHIRIHTGVKPYQCAFCEKKFTTSSQYKLHTKRHTGDRPWVCDVCNKTFLTKEAWRSHTRRHASERPFACPICSRGFIEQLSLKKHLRIHTGEKPYVCKVCNRAFSDCSNLTKHKKIHNKSLLLNHQELIMSKVQNELKPTSTTTTTTDDEKLGQFYYVTYNENIENVKETTALQLVEEVEVPIGSASNSGETNNDDSLSQTIEMIDLCNQLEVTDEFGNPIQFTTKDGKQLRVISYDGENLQVTTPDGIIIPVELNIEDGQTVAVEKQIQQMVSEEKEVSEMGILNEDAVKTVEFINVDDSFQVQLMSDDSNFESNQYLSAV